MDNLEALSRLPSGSVGLAYLDPPFNSGRSYDALVTAGRHVGKDHRGEAFTDQWAWSDATEDSLRRLPQLLSRPIASLVSGLVRSLGTSDLAAYLVMMAPRLGEVHRSLAETGSLYVHCDPGASHYLKVVLDYLFGPENFRNEIIWKRTHAHSSSRRYGPVHDTILFYSRSPQFTWNPVFAEYQASYIQNYFTHEDERGRYQLITCTAPGDRTGTRAHYEWKGKLPPPGRHWAWQKEQMGVFEREGKLVYSATGVPRFKHYVEDGAGVPLQDLWTDINRLDAHSDERIGYETQKPLALLERIVASSSKPDDIVLDAFCGTGTTMVAAERLGRQWIGIDTSLLGCAISLARLRQEVHAKGIQLQGFPSEPSVALQLLKAHPVAFGFWGTSMLGTLADRKTFSRSLATGVGRLQLDQNGLQVLSWVPLQHNIDRMIPHLRRSRLRRVAFILRVGRTSTGLREWVQQRLDVPVHEIPLDNLVEADSLKRGVASEVLRLAGAA